MNGDSGKGQRGHFDGQRGERRYENRRDQENRGERRYENRRDQENRGERRYDNRREQENRGERRYENRREQENRGEHRYENRRDQENRGERRYENRREQENRGERRYENRRDQDNRGEHRYENHRDQENRGERRYENRRDQENRGERRYENRHDQENRGERRYDNRREQENRGERRYDNRRGRDGARAVREIRSATARDVALTALGDVVRHSAYASQALDRALQGAKLSQEDRRLAAGLFYFAVENRLRIEWTLDKLMETKPEPVVADILHIAVTQLLFMDKIPDHAAVDEAVKQVRAAGRGGLDKLVNGVLRNLIRARDADELGLPDREEQPEEYLSVRYSLALPAVRRLVAAYGMDAAERIAAYQPPERTMTARPNLTRVSREDFEAMLSKEGFQWKRGAAEDSYILERAGGLAETAGYRDGLFSIQGESSMLAAQAVQAKPGMQILDACAAPGGKTCLMAERMGGAGRVYAWDIYPHRVELIRAAAKRLGLENVRPSVHDARKPLESMELLMDAVLVDAPCSGLGVMSDKPDIRFRTTDEGLDALPPLQGEILEACAKAVRVGGLLVYSTCTILPEENEAQVRAFLEKHPEFEMATDAAWLPEALRGRMDGGMIQLLPDRDGLEGFFIARMRRRSV